MQISSKLNVVAAPKSAPSEPTTPTNNGPDKIKDKDKNKDKTAPSLPPQTGGGLSMAAVWASQADRRAEEKAEVEAAKARTKVMPSTPNALVDGSDAAVRLMKDTVAEAEANRARAEKAAEARKAEQSKKEDPFAPKEVDPLRSEPEADVEASTPPAPGFQAYQTTLNNEDAGTGSKLDSRF